MTLDLTELQYRRAGQRRISRTGSADPRFSFSIGYEEPVNPLPHTGCFRLCTLSIGEPGQAKRPEVQLTSKRARTVEEGGIYAARDVATRLLHQVDQRARSRSDVSKASTAYPRDGCWSCNCISTSI